MKPPDQGIYNDVPMAVYNSWEAARSSTLKLMTERSPAHAWREICHPRKPTGALEFGQAIHCAVLEPERFEKDYVARPKIDRRTKAGKTEWAEFEDEHKHKEIINLDEFEGCLQIRAAAARHPTISRIMLGQGANEVSAIYQDRDTGTPCKIRPDRLVMCDGNSFCVDLKSCLSAEPRAFAQACQRFGYASQAAMYLEGLNTLSPLALNANPRRHIWIAVEKSPPWEMAVYELDERGLEHGHREHKRQLATYATAIETGIWEGYPTDVQPLSLPRWATYEEDE